ncbi:MAG: hypothetical protein IPJ75_03805 [Ignavibacteriales bacterium]|nr:hypothetical protein [Ignavibacteriales bacterium]
MRKLLIELRKKDEIPAQTKAALNVDIPSEVLGDSNAIEIGIFIEALYQGNLIPGKRFFFTVERELTTYLTYEDIIWNDGRVPIYELFKGRKELIADLSRHYLSVERYKSYVLYGLTRTGKSSILTYLMEDIDGEIFTINGVEKRSFRFLGSVCCG